MLICHVVSGLMYGGGQQVALELSSRLHRQPGTRTLLVLLGMPNAGSFPTIESPWVTVSYDGRYNRLSSIVRTAVRVRRILRRYRPDIVHSHGWDADVIVGLSRKGLRVQQVVHQHVLAGWTSSPRSVHQARRVLTRVALKTNQSHWIAVSEAAKRTLRGLSWLGPDVIRVIANGVDLESYGSTPRTMTGVVPTVGVAARLAPLKGIEYLIDAIATVNRRGMPCVLRIAGEGSARRDLESCAAAAGISSLVTFLGHQRDMPAFYATLDVFVLPSLSEGLPLTILEAMAAGLPVIGTDVSSIPDVVVDGRTGRIVPPADSDALADAIGPLILSGQLRAGMGSEGRLRAERLFSIERTVAEMAALYDEIGPRARDGIKSPMPLSPPLSRSIPEK